MKRLLCLTLALVLTVGLSACQNSNENNNEPQSGEDAYVETETQAISTSDYYADVLNKYYRALNTKGSMEGYVYNDELSVMVLANRDPENVGYLMADYDKDGSQELYIASTDEDDKVIYAMYRKIGQGAGPVFKSSLRNRFYMVGAGSDMVPAVSGGDLAYANNASANSSDRIYSTYSLLYDGDFELYKSIAYDLGRWYDIGTGQDIDYHSAQTMVNDLKDSYYKPEGFIPFSEFEPDPAYGELDISYLRPIELESALESATENDMLAVWLNPSEELILYAGDLHEIDDTEDIIVIMSLMDKRSVSLNSTNLYDAPLYDEVLDSHDFLSARIYVSGAEEDPVRTVNVKEQRTGKDPGQLLLERYGTSVDTERLGPGPVTFISKEE